MRKLALCAAGFALGALATVEIARSPAASEQGTRDVLQSAVRVSRLDRAPTVPHHQVIQIDEVLVLGEVKPASRPKRLVPLPSPIETEPSSQELASVSEK